MMRHEDQTGTELVLDAETLMVMGAGRQFWNAERTLRSDPRTACCRSSCDRSSFTDKPLVTGADVILKPLEDSSIVAFAIDPDAPVTRQSTIGR